MKKRLIILFAVLCLSGCIIHQKQDEELTAEITAAPETATAAEDFEYKIATDKAALKKYIGDDNYVVIPAEIEGVPVTEIDGNFLKDTSITELKISEGITKIPCFKDGGVLRKITLPSTLEAFTSNLRSCNSLEEINIGESDIYKSSDGVLYTADGKTLLSFPPARKGGFTVPDEVETIDYYAFWRSSLSEITLSKSLSEIKDYAFSEAGITDLTLPSSVKKIGFGAFKKSSLEHITLNEGLETIDGRAFDIEGLKELYIPSSVQKCGYAIANENTAVSASYPIEGLKFLCELNITFRDETTLQRAVRYVDELISDRFYTGFRHGKIYTDITGDNFPELIAVGYGKGGAYIYYFDFVADIWRDIDVTGRGFYFGEIKLDDEYYVCYDEKTNTKLLYSPVGIWNGWTGMGEAEPIQYKLTISHSKIEANVLYGEGTVDISKMNIIGTFSMSALLEDCDYDLNESFELLTSHFASEPDEEINENMPLLWRDNKEIISFPYYSSHYPEDMKLTVAGKDILRGEKYEGIIYKGGELTLNNANIKLDKKEGRAIYCSGMTELTVNLIGDNKISGDNLYSVFNAEDIPVIIKGDGSLTSTMLGAKSLTISENARVFESIEIERPVEVRHLNITENAELHTDLLYCESINASGSGKVFARRSEPEYISLSENAYMEIVMDENVENKYSGGRAIDCARSIKITDNAKLYAENKLCDTVFCYPDGNVTVSGKGVLEINGNADSMGLALNECRDGTLTVNDEGTVRIYNAGACVFAEKIVLNGGTLDCKAAHGGGSVYVSPFVDFGEGFFINGEIVSQSHSNWEMKELVGYADLIAADGEFLSEFSITVKQTDS